MKERKRGLYICNAYNNFQKDSIEAVSKYLDNCFVHVRLNPVAELSKYLKIPYLNRFRSDYRVDLTDLPLNVTVYPKYMLYGPIDFQYQSLGKVHFNSVQRLIKDNNLKFDFIHSHFTWSSGYAGAKLKEKYDVPFIVTAHGYDIYDLPFKNDKWKSKIEYILNSADAIITVSNSNLECIKKLDVNTPVTVIPNGYREDLFYPIDTFECRKLLSLPSNKKIILSVGNLEEVKGHKFLVEAMSQVVKRRKDVLCFIVGGGKLETQLEKQIKLAGLNDYVKLVGDKPHNEIPLWMNACDILILPSLRESFGVVQIEAMACGKPVVATRNGGSEEIITSDDLGFLVEVANPLHLSQKILISLDYKWDAFKIINYAGQFTWDNVVSKIIKAYRGIHSFKFL
ncbi:MAG: glycosyltransferase family 4 protein [Methanobacterium sp.]